MMCASSKNSAMVDVTCKLDVPSMFEAMSRALAERGER